MSTVVEHMRAGDTQLHAFREAGLNLNRTESACGFRWNGVLRKHYRDEITKAKAESKRSKASTLRSNFTLWSTKVAAAPSQAIREVISYLRELDGQYQALRMQYAQLLDTCEQLRVRVKNLEADLENRRTAPVYTREQFEHDVKKLLDMLTQIPHTNGQV
ncbi:MAG: RsfA family transcriptional regulator [Alicyclobacillus sp.]|nr:RsfA family transcriptional regulator [Alicyclobacillus sp.]